MRAVQPESSTEHELVPIDRLETAAPASGAGGDAIRPPIDRGPTTHQARTATGRQSRPSSDELTEGRVLRPAASAPPHGWRRLIHRLTLGQITPTPSAAEQARRELRARVGTPLRGPRVIAVVSTKGGVGKTTTTVTLGHTFATSRGDRVVAVDGNPDAGTLAYRIPRETPATIDDLLTDVPLLARYADVRGFTSQASSRLEVLAAPDNPALSTALDDADYRRLFDMLERHYQLLLVDCGTGILDAATRGIVEAADQLVVVTGPSLDAARATSFLLDWLDCHGCAPQVEQAVAVINAAPDRDGVVDLHRIHDHFAARCRAVVRIPYDRQLAAGATIDLDRLAPATRHAYLELAAAVADNFIG